jgi:hypothetical protein
MKPVLDSLAAKKQSRTARCASPSKSGPRFRSSGPRPTTPKPSPPKLCGFAMTRTGNSPVSESSRESSGRGRNQSLKRTVIGTTSLRPPNRASMAARGQLTGWPRATGCASDKSGDLIASQADFLAAKAAKVKALNGIEENPSHFEAPRQWPESGTAQKSGGQAWGDA